MKFRNLFLFLLAPIFLAGRVLAHCPLCTLGVGAAVGGAAYLGVNKVVLSLLVGAFAISMGMWFARVVKKKYVPFQKTLIIFVSFFLTVIPLLPLINAYFPLTLWFVGEYGKTYAVNAALIGSFFGGLLVLVSPTISKKITKIRGRHMNYQTMVLTFLLLAVSGLIVQLWL
ncbi:MAG: hypothetical protein KJ592_01800 [Nanoarchaeota archaeon]|nr:hypothetical protein [Nanoarchaeota archaeon]